MVQYLEFIRWPSTAACPYCWLDNQGSGSNAGKSGTAAFNRTAVYQHLKEIYWPRGPQHFKYVVLDKVERSKVHKLTLREELELFLVIITSKTTTTVTKIKAEAMKDANAIASPVFCMIPKQEPLFLSSLEIACDELGLVFFTTEVTALAKS